MLKTVFNVSFVSLLLLPFFLGLLLAQITLILKTIYSFVCLGLAVFEKKSKTELTYFHKLQLTSTVSTDKAPRCRREARTTGGGGTFIFTLPSYRDRFHWLWLPPVWPCAIHSCLQSTFSEGLLWGSTKTSTDSDLTKSIVHQGTHRY